MPKLPKPANTENNQETLNDFSMIPAGTYASMVISSEYKPMKDGQGHRLAIMHKIIEGEFTGRTLPDGFNLNHPNPMTVELANKALNTLCKACNKVGVQDSEELHGIKIMITVDCDEDSPYPNHVTFYEPYQEPAFKWAKDTPVGNGTSSGYNRSRRYYRPISSTPVNDISTDADAPPFSDNTKETEAESQEKLPWE